MTGFRGAADPFQFGFHFLGATLVLLSLGLQTCGLGLEVRGVVALVGVKGAAVDFADPLGDVVQEVTVVGDGQNGALVVLQELLEPQNALGVEVVGRLVKKKQVGGFKKKLAQSDAPALAAGKVIDHLVGVGALKRVHCLGKLAVQVPAVGCIDFVLQAAHFLH